jgi:dethiobiotin synthetase
MIGGIFITGTDTGVGKTVAASALLRGLVASGFRAVGMKPVAAGLELGSEVGADAAKLIAAGNVRAPLGDVSPYSFVPAIAPHVAAADVGVVIELDVIAAAFRRLADRADAVIVEGAGGALVPLNAEADMLDIAARLGLPVLLVVGVRLGFLNHALLSALAINARGLRLAGWIANRIDPAMQAADAGIATLAGRLPAPLLADFAWQPGTTPPLLSAAALRALGFVAR